MAGARKTGRKRFGKDVRKREKPFKEPKRRILIVCEGEKTEPKYLNDLIKEKRLSATEVNICGKECGTQPNNIIEYAKDQKLKKNDNEYDEIWCVFDKDENTETEIKQAFNKAKQYEFKIAFSNPCFEIWYLFHFQPQTAHIERNDAVRELKGYISGYSKSKDVYHYLLENQDTAINNAEALRIRHIKNDNKDYENPSTSVDKLVKYLNEQK